MAAGSDPCDQYRTGSANWKRCKGLRHAPPNPSTDDEIYHAGYWLAKSGKYEIALAMLRRAEDQSDPRILNYLGFATRKLGRVDEGLIYYRKALAIDPNYVLAREYMGEAYLQKGDIASAHGQLNEIAKRCGTTCSSYTQLSQLIAARSS